MNFEIRGHSKSTFVEEESVCVCVCVGGGGGFEKQTKISRRRRILACVYIRFLKENAEILKIKFYSYSPVFPIDYNGSMKY